MIDFDLLMKCVTAIACVYLFSGWRICDTLIINADKLESPKDEDK